MATRPALHTAVAKTKNKASDYNENFELMMSYCETVAAETTSYMSTYMPTISASTTSKFLTNNGSASNWQGLGNGFPFSNYLNGLALSKSSDDTIAVGAGSCYDSTGVAILAINASTTKQNESQAASTTYYVYIIGDGTNVDILIDDDTPTLPTGYTYYRLLGTYATDEDGNMDLVSSYGQAISAPKATASIVKYYINGSSWYRIWSDGWIEQGGIISTSSDTNKTISFLKKFSNTNYFICKNFGYSNSGGVAARWMGFWNKTTSGATTGSLGNSYNQCWYACGY